MFKHSNIEHCETRWGEIKGNVTRWKEMPSSGIGRFPFVNMVILTKLIYRFKAMPIKFQ